MVSHSSAFEPNPQWNSGLYLACSLGPGQSSAYHAALATWLGVECFEGRPLPADRCGLVLSATGCTLRVPGLPPTRWHPGTAGWRCLRTAVDPMIRALALSPGDRVLDATLGLGHDALVMRAAGLSVLGLEQHPLLAHLAFDGHVRQGAGPPLHLRVGDFREILPRLAGGSAEVVYFDPRFPAFDTDPNPTWAPIRALGAPGRLTDADFTEARRVARLRIVLKLSPNEAAPEPDGWVPRVVRSRRARFAVYDVAEST